MNVNGFNYNMTVSTRGHTHKKDSTLLSKSLAEFMSHDTNRIKMATHYTDKKRVLVLGGKV